MRSKANGKAALLIAALCAATLSSPAHADYVSIGITNRTGKTIRMFMIAPSPARIYSNTTAQPIPLNTNAMGGVSFSRTDGACKMDLLTEDTNGLQNVYGSLDICSFTMFTLSISNGKPSYTAAK
jgi:hypothetical protein